MAWTKEVKGTPPKPTLHFAVLALGSAIFGLGFVVLGSETSGLGFPVSAAVFAFSGLGLILSG